MVHALKNHKWSDPEWRNKVMTKKNLVKNSSTQFWNQKYLPTKHSTNDLFTAQKPWGSLWESQVRVSGIESSKSKHKTVQKLILKTWWKASWVIHMYTDTYTCVFKTISHSFYATWDYFNSFFSISAAIPYSNNWSWYKV